MLPFQAQNSSEKSVRKSTEKEHGFEHLLRKVPFMSVQHAKAYTALAKKQSNCQTTKACLNQPIAKSKNSSIQNISSCNSSHEFFTSRVSTKASTLIGTVETSPNFTRTSTRILSLISPSLARTHTIALKTFSEQEATNNSESPNLRFSLPLLEKKPVPNPRRSLLVARTQNTEPSEFEPIDLSKSVFTNERRISVLSANCQPIYANISSIEKDSSTLSISDIIDEDDRLNTVLTSPQAVHSTRAPKNIISLKKKTHKGSGLSNHRRLIKMTKKMDFTAEKKQTSGIQDVLVIKKCAKICN